MTGALGGADGRRQHVRDTAQARRRQVEVDGVERDEAEGRTAVLGQRLTAGERGPVPALPGRGVVDAVGGAAGVDDGDLVRQQAAVVPCQRGHLIGAGPLGAVGAGRQPYGGAGLRVLVRRQGTDGVAAVRVAAPLHDRGVGLGGGAADDGDLVGDDEAGEQPDPELADEVTARGFEFTFGGALGAAPYGGQKGVHIGLGQPDAGVGDGKGVTGADGDGGGGAGEAGLAGGDRVGGVLEQFAEVDAGAGVEVVGQQVDQAA